MPRTKRQLSGAAKEAHERKRARQQEQNEEEKRDPVDEQRASLEPTGAPAGNLTAEEARRRLDEYVKQGEGDKTAPRLRQFLAVVPAEGKPNIIRDILARDDNQLREFMADIRNSFFRPSKFVYT